MKKNCSFRPIERRDNVELKQIIRTVMPEFGARGEGYAINDPEIEDMYASYTRARHVYYVIEDGSGKIWGGAGAAPLEGASPEICELRKMYFYPEIRGMGWGKTLLAKILEDARRLEFRICYIETLERMPGARALYEKHGFKQICSPMGNTGHHKCDCWYLKEI